MLLKLKDTKRCLGTIYKYKENTFINAKAEIISKVSLYPMKKLSCSGCASCDWIGDYIQESIYNDTLKYLFSGNYEHGDLLYVHGSGGEGFFSDDYFEVTLRRYNATLSQTSS